LSLNLLGIQERDPEKNGLISFEQLTDAYRIYKVRFCYNLYIISQFTSFITKVGFEEDAAKSNFMKFAKNTKLFDFGDRKDESP
jgi:hypothetical protein